MPSKSDPPKSIKNASLMSSNISNKKEAKNFSILVAYEQVMDTGFNKVNRKKKIINAVYEMISQKLLGYTLTNE